MRHCGVLGRFDDGAKGMHATRPWGKISSSQMNWINDLSSKSICENSSCPVKQLLKWQNVNGACEAFLFAYACSSSDERARGMIAFYYGLLTWRLFLTMIVSVNGTHEPHSSNDTYVAKYFFRIFLHHPRDPARSSNPTTVTDAERRYVLSDAMKVKSQTYSL